MDRYGKVKVGLVVTIVVLAAVGYYGVEIGGVYWRKYRFGDEVTQQLGFAGQRSDDGIRQGILQKIDQMGLPQEARRFRLVRTEQPRRLRFSVTYTETVNLLFTTREISVRVEQSRRF